MNTTKIAQCQTAEGLQAHTVLICGDRDWNTWEPINELLTRLPANTLIIEGDARGADKMAGSAAWRNFGYHLCTHPADWNRFGKRAGFLRNKEMLDMHPSISHVYAFHDDIDASKGTKMMLQLARERGIPTTLITSSGKREEQPILPLTTSEENATEAERIADHEKEPATA